MKLGEFMISLGRVEDKSTPVRFDFGGFKPTTFDSYRGYYQDLALGYSDMPMTVTVEDVLKEADKVLNRYLAGYKGGNYFMTIDTELWAACYGEAYQTRIKGVMNMGHVVIITTRYDG